MYLLDIEPLDLGSDVKSIGLDLVEADENREPVRGPDAARIWSRVLQATAGQDAWVLDFYSHTDRVRDYCERHQIRFREANPHTIVVPAPTPDELELLIGRFLNETFGARAGGSISGGDAGGTDAVLEGNLARHGADAYQDAFKAYLFCGICGFEDGSLVLLSGKLWASEVIRRVRPALDDLDVEVRLPA
jgi:hypothetical protein